jgi:hypothetical protein
MADVWVVQRRGDLRLTEECAVPLVSAGRAVVGVQKLEGHLTLEPSIQREVDRPHATTSQHGNDVVRSDRTARLERHGLRF